jgi:hypothetical protein
VYRILIPNAREEAEASIDLSTSRRNDGSGVTIVTSHPIPERFFAMFHERTDAIDLTGGK